MTDTIFVSNGTFLRIDLRRRNEDAAPFLVVSREWVDDAGGVGECACIEIVNSAVLKEFVEKLIKLGETLRWRHRS